MSSIGTFGTFTQARLGIYTAQQGLSVVGNNISNINTPGYTRQALDQISLYARGADRYHQKYDVRIGGGSLAIGVSQIRDPYLDIRYRSQSASVGYYDTTLGGLNSIAQILDDVGAGKDENGIIGAQFSDLLKSLQNLTDQTGQDVYDSQVRTSAAALVSLFNSMSTSLQEVYDNSLSSFKQDLTTVNEILNNIRDLNTTIRKSDLHGDPALELRDERNRLIDQLSEYVKVNVSYTEEDIGAGMKVEKLTIRLAGANPDQTVNSDSALLVDGRYAAQFTLPETTPKLNPKYDPNGTPPDNLKYLKLEADGITWTPTDNPEEAKQVENDLFLMGLTKLYDDRGREWTNLDKPATTYQDPAELQAAKDALIAKGATPDPNNSDAYILEDENNVKYIYTFDTANLTMVSSQASKDIDLDDNDLYGSFQASRELLTESGEFASTGCINGIDEKAASKRGIPYYQKALDLLANRFAAAFNEANTGYMTDEKGNYIKDDGTLITLGNMPNGDPIPVNKYQELTQEQKDALAAANLTEDELNQYLENNGAYKPEGAGNLFSSSGDGNNGEGITASNISISLDWLHGNTHLVSSYVKPSMLDGTASMDNENIVHFRALMEAKLKYIPSDVAPEGSDIPMFTGSFMEMVNQINSTLGNAQRSTEIELTTSYASAVEIDTSRDSVSGVDLNDEAVNMIQYQKAYSAACRLMTAIDEALERLISNTGVVGR